ncbi:SDR family NAD(P)-dependent oxidoreductase [Brevibacillus sp. Leaf182]|uniref:SDR family NAD(P)-dependent oxidoreductase n=1 Tax=Brevibacillus sp. Leaf182 TaxID=1736290 RepID=UPI003519FC05
MQSFLGLSLAKKFGENGFKVVPIARNPEKLAIIESELRKQNIETQSFVADITDLAALKRAIQAAKKEFGSIDVLEFSTYAKENTFTSADRSLFPSPLQRAWLRLLFDTPYFLEKYRRI